MTINIKEQNKKINAWMDNMIKSEYQNHLNTENDVDLKDAYIYVMDRFCGEYRTPRNKNISEWFGGLSINIPYTYHDIDVLYDSFGFNDGQKARREDFFKFAESVFIKRFEKHTNEKYFFYNPRKDG